MEGHGWIVMQSPQGLGTKIPFSDATGEWDEEDWEDNDMAAPELQLGLSRVRVQKDALLKQLKENLEKHKVEFASALKGWKIEVIEEMERNFVAARGGKGFELHIEAEKPHDHSEDYDHVISLLTASMDDVIILSADEFRQYHDDQWHWKGRHRGLVDTYSVKR